MPRLVLIACAAAVAALFVLIPAGEAFSFPIIEFASGAGTVTDSSFGGSTLTFSFNASSGPTSENVSGTFSFDLSATAYQPDEKWSGNVTCLFVQGSEATMGLLVTASANPQMPVGSELLWSVQDGGPGGSGDGLSWFYDEPNLTCLGFHGFPDSSLASGAISVVDGGATFPNGPNLSPPDDVGTAGTSHTVTAAVFSYRDDLLPGIQVLFSVQGSVNTTGACTTDSSGQCSFTYQGPGFPGADLITACSDANHNGIVDEDERCTTTTQAWVLPTTTAGHITGGGQVLDASGSDYDAFGFTAQSDNSGIKGECTMVDPAASVKIKCLDVTTVSKSGTHATLFGDATVNGTPTTYRIDVDDLGEPGTGNDTFKLQTASGYTAGGVIQSGNIQIH